MSNRGWPLNRGLTVYCTTCEKVTRWHSSHLSRLSEIYSGLQKTATTKVNELLREQVKQFSSVKANQINFMYTVSLYPNKFEQQFFFLGLFYSFKWVCNDHKFTHWNIFLYFPLVFWQNVVFTRLLKFLWNCNINKKNTVNCTIISTNWDPLGRYIISKIQIDDKIYVFINVYARATSSWEVIITVLSILV